MSGVTNSEITSAPQSAQNVATTAGVSTAIIDVLGGNSPGFYDVSVKGSAVHILFGASNVADASLTNAMFLPVNGMRRYWVDTATRYCKAIATDTVADQVVSIARSGP